jgi:HK97 family phage major capsid protein
MSTKNLAAVRELRAIYTELDALTKGSRELTKGEEARKSVLLAKAKMVQQNPDLVVDDFCKRWFRAFLNDATLPVESRTDGQAGTQSIVYTQEAAGGALVPIEFADQLFVGMAQIDPLLNPDITTVITRTNNRPYVIPSWDLTTIKALKKAEAAQNVRANRPAAKNDKIAGGDHWTYIGQLAASFELEDDDFQPILEQLSLGLAVSLARGIGADLAVGDGTTGPQGVANATDSGVTQTTINVLTDVDIDNVFYAVDPFYRNAPKCAWLVTDAVHKQIRKAKDSNNRPLINVVNGAEFLLGKPLYISPSLPAYNASLGTQTSGSFCVFGDLSRYVVTLTQPRLQRSLNNGTVGAEYGEALYTAVAQADAKIIDPTGGSKPPIVAARLHS